MSFKRILVPANPLQGEALTSALIGIGIRLGGTAPSVSPNIEDALFFAVIESLNTFDYRVLALATDWLSLHSEAVNVDRLNQLVVFLKEPLAQSYWAAVGQWLAKDTRWKKLAQKAPSLRLDLFDDGTDFLIDRHGGEDERFDGTCLRVPKNSLRHRPEDILSREALAARHRGYYYRLMIGPTYRADMWAFLEEHPNAAAADIARAAYGSFTTAWAVKRDFDYLLNARRLMRKSA